MDPTDRELLRGMGNCYRACREDYEATVRMVARARGLEPEWVKDRLAWLRDTYGSSDVYQRLRARMPDDFPL